MASKEKIAQNTKSLSIRLLFVAGIFLLALAVFAFIADEMVLENENYLDQVVFAHLKELTNPFMTKLMVAVTFFGSSYFLFPAYILLILYFLFLKKNKQLSWNIAAVGITSTVILFSLKAIFHRHRPLDPLVQNVNGFSFPSGHSFSSFTFFGLLIYILWHYPMSAALRWTLTIFFFFFACAIAFSRVYLHVHYASDVIAGFCLCLVWLGLSFWLLEKLGRTAFKKTN
ncbi:phosphatase PAP2 family protein [Flavisolibacter ginsenosidimutans]|nr:phosphatase PAP2 family protein [Flavisolibacter ginsenosidimutans]